MKMEVVKKILLLLLRDNTKIHFNDTTIQKTMMKKFRCWSNRPKSWNNRLNLILNLSLLFPFQHQDHRPRIKVKNKLKVHTNCQQKISDLMKIFIGCNLRYSILLLNFKQANFLESQTFKCYYRLMWNSNKWRKNSNIPQKH